MGSSVKNKRDRLFFTQLFVPQASQSSQDRSAELEVLLAVPSAQSACGMEIFYVLCFYKAYGMEIEDKRTVYGECTYRLVPREDEPSVCLMHDWIYLPTA